LIPRRRTHPNLGGGLRYDRTLSVVPQGGPLSLRPPRSLNPRTEINRRQRTQRAQSEGNRKEYCRKILAARFRTDPSAFLCVLLRPTSVFGLKPTAPRPTGRIACIFPGPGDAPTFADVMLVMALEPNPGGSAQTGAHQRLQMKALR
jgi:hypothetical protein